MITKKRGLTVIGTLVSFIVAIVILILLVMLITGQFRDTGKTITDCSVMGGTCMSRDQCLEKGGQPAIKQQCTENAPKDENWVCCVGT